MRSRLTKSLVALVVSAFTLVTAFGAASAFAEDPPPALENSSSPFLSSTPTVGYSVAVEPGLWQTVTTLDGVPQYESVTPTSFSYQWNTVSAADIYAPISGATASSLLVTPDAYAAGRVAVEITAHLDGFESASSFTVPVTVNQNSDAVYATTDPSISGGLAGYVAIGSTLTLNAGDWSPASVGTSQQWVTAAACADIAAGAPIAGATSTTLVVPADADGLCVGAIVTGGGSGYSGAATRNAIGGYAATAITGTISGHALDKRGDPVAGLTVKIISGTTETAVTDSAGYFSKSGLPFQTYSIAWDAFGDFTSGYPMTTVSLNPAAPNATYDVTPQAINRMYGTLTDADGLGIEGASLYFPGTGYTLNAITDANGAFNRQLNFVTSGTYDLAFATPTCTAANEYPATPFSVVDTGLNLSFDESVINASNNGALQLFYLDFPVVSDSTPDIGQTLTTTTGNWWCANGASYDYQWYRDGAAIDGATASSYVVSPDDGEAQLSVKVWAVTSHGKKHGSLSDATSEVAVGAAPTPVGSPAITWSGSGSAPMFGDTLGFSGSWSIPGGTTTYEWRTVPFNTGVPAPLATSATVAAPADIAGDPNSSVRDKVDLVVTYSVPGYAQATYTANSVWIDWAPAPVQLTPASITGDLRVGEDVSFDIGTWDVAGSYASYAGWRMGPVAFVGFGTIATGGTFTIPSTYDGYVSGTPSVGAFVDVSLIVTAAGHAPSLVASANAGPILAPYLTNVTPVQIDGIGTTGCCLEAIAGTYTSTPTTRTYTWYSSTSSTGPWAFESESLGWAPNLSKLGKYVKLVETVALGAETAGSESAPLLIDTDDATFISTLTPAGYVGNAVVGTTVTAVPAVWDRPGVTVIWEWVLMDGTDYDLVGAGSSYVVQPSDLGRTLWVMEQGSLPGGLMITSGAEIGLVTAPTTPAPTPTPSPTAPPLAPGDDAADYDASDEQLSDEELNDDSDQESAETEEPGVSGDDGDSSEAASNSDETPGSAATTALLIGAGVVVIGGLAGAGWWFFIRRPF